MTEETLFEIKQKFLREIPHPKLIQKQIDRLKEFEKEGMRADVHLSQGELKLIPFLENYIAVILTLKLGISNAVDGSALLSSLINLNSVQLALIAKLASCMPEEAEFEGEKIKQSNPIDAYKLLKELTDNGVDDKDLKDYLCTQLEKGPEGYTELTKSVIQAKKIEEHG